MSFSNIFFQNKPNILSFYSLLQNLFLHKSRNHSKTKEKKAPLYASKLSASYTVEAAFILPLSLFFLIFVLFFARIMITKWEVDYALFQAATETATVCQQKEETNPLMVFAYCNKKISNMEIATTTIQNGYLGINYSDSDVSKNAISLSAKYRIRMPFSIFGTLTFEMESRKYARKWIGYDPLEDDDLSYVYITEYGKAYHTIGCAYLHPSVHTGKKEEMSRKRNSGGAKYSSCPLCKGNKASVYVYYTEYGDRYHSTLSCKGLKRSIKRIKKEEAVGYHPCPKCMKKE